MRSWNPPTSRASIDLPNPQDGGRLEVDEADSGFGPMKWTKPQYGTARVTAAGKIISERKPASQQLTMDAAFEIAANWRSSHAYPLHVLAMTLRNRARQIDPHTLVAQRVKRMPSIVAKLKRFQGMQLSQMQDLGGCKAVV